MARRVDQIVSQLTASPVAGESKRGAQDPASLVTIAKKVDGVAIIVIDHKPVNSYSNLVHAALQRAYSEAIAATDVRAIVITGTGAFFMAGADISGIQSTKRGAEGSAQFHKFATEANALFSTIESGKKPVVAAVNGTAFGGGLELAMTCNARIGTPKSQYGLPELKIGLIPAFGGCVCHHMHTLLFYCSTRSHSWLHSLNNCDDE
jgi:enoyl-CoA hydratase/carnithine racemase